MALVLILTLVILSSAAIVSATGDRVIQVRGDNNYPPYEYIGDDGQPAGWNIDLIRAVAKEEGLNISIRLGPWDEVRSDLETGKIDLLAGMYYSPDRARYVNFSAPHILVSHAIFVRQGSEIHSIDDLKNRSVLVQRGDIMHDYIRNLDVTDKIVPVESQEDALILLSKGSYDCALVAKLQGLYTLDHLGLTNIDVLDPPLEPRAYAFAVSPANQDLIPVLNEGLAIVKKSGKYSELYQKWFGVYEEKKLYSQILTVVMAILLPVGVLIILVLLWSWSLRSQVALKTAELKGELARRIQIEADLQKSEERNAAIIAAMPDLLFILSRDGKYLDYHVPDARLLPLAPEDIIGRSLWDTGFDRETGDRIIRAIGRTLDSGKLEQVSYTHPVPSGVRSFEARLIRLDSERVLGIVRDVTESRAAEDALRENEELLGAIVENIPDMIFVKDTPGLRIIRLNRAGEELLGYSRSEMNGKSDYDFFPKEEADLFNAKDREVLRQMRIADIGRETIMTRNRGERILHTTKIPIPDKAGHPKYLLGISEDITDRVRFEEALHKATGKLNLLTRITFTDIQNAIFSLSGYLNLEKRIPADELTEGFRNKQTDIIRKIETSLRFAKNYQDLGIRPPAWQNVSRVFLMAISHIDLAGLHRNIQSDTLEIYADPLLEKVFLTLAENVLRHAADVTEISLTWHETGEGLTLLFEDNGPGIPRNMKEAIFERYGEGGIGMNLFLSREILSITGISIRETGSERTGARFEILVPKGGYRFT
jgi:PAS domain S-box-containing protein